MSASDLDARLVELAPKGAARYFASRERFFHEKLPKAVQSEVGRLILEDMAARLGRLVQAMPKTRPRLKWCSKACCKGKPNQDRHGPYSVTEVWDPTTKTWRTLKKRDQWKTAREAERAVLGVQVDAEAAPDAFELPRRATAEDQAAFAAALKT